MGDFYGTPPNSNLTGLIYICVILIANVDMKPGMLVFSEDLSGFICVDRIDRMDMKLET